MLSSLLTLVSTPDGSSGNRLDGRLTAELERSSRFGQRHRELEGVLPTGSITLDAAMGVGGLPRGRMVELFGPAAIGKTTLGLQAVAAVQMSGGTVAFVDAERAFDPSYAMRLGVDTELLLLARTEDGEQALRVVEKLAASKAVDLIVVDSVAALLPPEEREEALGEVSPFGQSEMLASGLRRISRALQGSPACVLFLNQVRGYRGFGYSETSAGGWAVKLHSAVRADLHGETGSSPQKRLRLRVIKNQLAKPVQTDFEFEAGVGVVAEAELIDRGVETHTIQSSKDGLLFQGQNLGRTRLAARARLAENSALAAEVRTEVRLALGLTQRRPAGREERPVAIEKAAAVNG